MAKDLASSTFEFLPVYASAGLIYLMINTAVAVLGRRLKALPGGPAVTFELDLITENAGAILGGIA